MKTQVIQLEPHDDVVSVRDKMSWAKAPRLLLVYPRRGRLLDRTLDLLLLQRHASTLGAQLALTTRSLEVRRAAQELGLPVFTSAVTAQQERWPAASRHRRPLRRAPRPDLKKLNAEAVPPEPAWVSKPAVRFAVFTLGVLAMLAVLLLFVPSAEITLYPAFQTQSLSLPVSASPAVTAVSVTGNVPAQTVSVTVSGSKTISVSGQMVLPEQPARSLVRFRNLTDIRINIPTGTVVRTLGEPIVRFATLQDGVVEAGVNQSVGIPVQAILPGSVGNVAEDTIIAIEGSLGSNLAATNPEPASGGTDLTVTAASISDRTALYNDLLAKLRQSALSQINSQMTEGDLIFPDTLDLKQTLDEEYLPAEGQPGKYLTLNLTQVFTAHYAAASDLNALATTVLDVSLPAGSVPVPDTLTVASVSVLVTDAEGVTHGRLLVVRYLAPHIDALTIARLVRGHTLASARVKLASALELASPSQIQVTPSWWPWLPLTEIRITVNY